MKELDVKLYGRLLGTITRDDRTHETRLTYAKEYLDDPRTVALSARLPKQEQPIVWERAERWFGGLLPERERRARIAREVGAARMSTYSMLEAIGAECAGAVTVTSVLYPEDGSVRLSPDYDAVCTMRYGGLARGMAWCSLLVRPSPACSAASFTSPNSRPSRTSENRS